MKIDHGGDFENDPFKSFCEKHEIFHDFSCPITPRQKGVVE
jgi:hypothetical protein